MALTTRCPQCGTSFKVVPDQLRVRNGLVRCGACSTVFDGRACLLSEPGAPVAPTAPASAPLPSSVSAAGAPVLAAPAQPRMIAPWEDEPVAPQAPAVPPAVLRGRDHIRRRAEPDPDLPEQDADDADDGDAGGDTFFREAEPRLTAPVAPPVAPPAFRDEPRAAGRGSEPVFDWAASRQHDDVRDTERDDEYQGEDEFDPAGAREPVLGDARTRYSSATDVGRAPPEFLDQDRQERRSLWRKLWGYACLIGLIVFGLQLLYAYRTDIANSVPALRPVLETVCQPLGCTVGYARRLERIAISSSSLQPPTGAAAIDDGRSRLVLNLVLRNRYDKPQHWPALVLDLTDLSDTVVVRKVLMPENYLTPAQLAGPFGPAGELKISVPIEVTGVQVNGYQLDKFFP
ncbi:hypothetical protein ASE30_18055 [Achromobacter sp. Root83]|uniref:DUF3426 domain-containing protein n=1 Tax=Achromobacter sp. Root83 TaxID=1736602 RepID=UPI000709916D|nr:DUF3426 domain-containing protein [Achromobacter sp. Root83]KRC70378.1 hypothetical protein ASE30_18055 [Achromobacter sp. Root83]